MRLAAHLSKRACAGMTMAAAIAFRRKRAILVPHRRADGRQDGRLAGDPGRDGPQDPRVDGSLHGYGIARRIEQTSGELLSLNYGTLYPALVKLEQEGYVASEWGASENNRRAKYYRLTRAGRRKLEEETREWEQATAIVARFLQPATREK